MNRPTYKELNKKLSEARFAVSEGLVNLVNPEAAAADAMELGYSIENDLMQYLSSVLNSTTPGNYAGRRPPDQSYENIIMANPLYAFKINSEIFSCLIYIKFTIFENELWVVSFHKNRNKKRGTKP